jgi:hypothetical protein
MAERRVAALQAPTRPRMQHRADTCTAGSCARRHSADTTRGIRLRRRRRRCRCYTSLLEATAAGATAARARAMWEGGRSVVPSAAAAALGAPTHQLCASCQSRRRRRRDCMRGTSRRAKPCLHSTRAMRPARAYLSCRRREHRVCRRRVQSADAEHRVQTQRAESADQSREQVQRRQRVHRASTRNASGDAWPCSEHTHDSGDGSACMMCEPWGRADPSMRASRTWRRAAHPRLVGCPPSPSRSSSPHCHAVRARRSAHRRHRRLPSPRMVAAY